MGFDSIALTKDVNQSILKFDEGKTRNMVLKQIWDEIKNDSRIFDIDEFIEIYKDAGKYNL